MKTGSIDSLVNKYNPEPETVNLRSERHLLQQQVVALKKQIGERNEIVKEIINAVVANPSARIVQQSAKSSAVTSEVEAVLHLTDWHVGQVTVASEIEGFNVYNFAKSVARVKSLADKVLSWVALHQHAYKVPKLRVLVTGDLISGDIHDELKVTNEFPAPVQAVKAGYLLGDLLSTLAPQFREVVVEFITLDNHGRLTRKPQKSQGGFNNFSYIVGYVAKERVSNQKNVTVTVHPYSNVIVHIPGRRYLCGHGHGIIGTFGIPYYGLQRKVGREAEARMNMSEDKHFDKIIIGHFHQPLSALRWKIGGSLSGTDANDHSEGRHCDPCQTAWLVHPKHGEFDETTFWL
jgi:hypothetical protein